MRRIARHPKSLLASLLLAVACSDGATEPEPPANRAPVVGAPIPARTVAVGERVEVNAAGHFSDPDGDALTYSASSSDGSVASAAVSGSVVTVTGLSRGTATVTVAATDPGGLSAEQTFEVTVPNRAPVADAPIPAQTVAVGERVEVNAAGHFSDPDGDALTYSASSSEGSVASAAVAGSVVTITGLFRGTATVTVAATDPGGLSAEQTFEVTVPNRAPVAGVPIPAQTVAVGERVEVNAAGHFGDPDGDALTYSASSSDGSVASAAVIGSVVTVTGLSRGTATVTVAAADPGGLSAEQTFEVTVPNRAPVAGASISAQTVAVAETVQIDAAGHFSDPDGDVLTYSASSSDGLVASAAVAGSVVTVTGLSQGTATVTVAANDPWGLSAEQTFEVTVPNRAPVAGASLPAQTVAVEERVEIEAAGHFSDPDGDALTYSASSSDASVASAAVSGSVVMVTGLSRGTATVTVAANDPWGLSAEQTFEVTVPNRAPVAGASLPAQTVAVEERVEVDVAGHFSDPDGDALTYSASSSDASVALAAVSGSVVTVRALSRGTATVTVVATDPGGLSAEQTFGVTVSNRAPVAGASLPAQAVEVGQRVEVDVAGHFSDPDGDVLTYSASSSDGSVASAAVSGSVVTVTGLSRGTATVTVAATDPWELSTEQTFEVTVTATAAVVIAGTDPAVLLEGATATIRGSGFSPNASGNRVLLGGLDATVTHATESTLLISVPQADCQPPRRTDLRVTVSGRTGTRTVGVTPLRDVDLALQPGWYRYSGAGKGCVQLPAGGEYLIGAVSVAEDVGSLASVALAGTRGDATVAANAGITGDAPLGWFDALAAASTRGPPGVSAAAAIVLEPDGFAGANDPTLRQAEAHNRMMARNAALLRELGRRDEAATGEAIPSPAATAQVGDTISLYADYNRTCSNSRQIQAKVRLAGAHVVWLEDLANPATTFTNAELVELDTFYGATAKSVHDSYFGRMSDVDGNGRFLVLMTREANRAGVNGWVWFGDTYPREQCPTSNFAEVFYGRVPDPDGIAGAPVTREALLRQYPGLLTHEVTHLVQAAAYSYGGSGLKASWELEGGATLAEQLVAYQLFGHGSGRELGWDEIRRSDDAYYWYSNAWLGDMALFFGWDPRGAGSGRIERAPEECSWLGRPSEGNSSPCRFNGRAVYGVPSMVLRYAMDRWGSDYPGGESALMTRLTQSPLRGFASLEDVSPSWRIENILADFYITLWLDLAGAHTYGMGSWNLADIFSRLPENTRLQPYRSSSVEPRLAARIRAGSSLYLHWTPATTQFAPTSIKVGTLSGGGTPRKITVWALRVR